MKGLIIKDFALMMQRKKSFILIVIGGLCMNFSSDGTYAVFWLIMIGSMMATSTIAYDEFDNCYPFLMSLPISRKDYAIEKYVFGIICSGIGWLIGFISYVVTALIKGNAVNIGEDLIMMVTLLLIPVLILDISLPFTLKYGTEKGRIYMLASMASVFGACFLIYRIIAQPLSSSIKLNSISMLVIAILIFVSILTVISLKTSISIMNKKEF